VANIPATQTSAPRPAPAATRAVFLDALGTLVDLEPPWIGLRRALGGAIPEDRLITAVRTEMSYYRDHSIEGHDAASLADLRRRCAAVLSEGLGVEVSAATLVSAIHFSAFADSAPALAALRERGLVTVCVSNWDVSLARVLERCGLAPGLDAIVCSAEAGARKPDPAIFERALTLAGCSAGEAVHVGDTPDEDLEGAHAAGIRALLIRREGGGDVSSLAEVTEVV
jgi:putative hydrolase of the HAD superfamily